MVQEWQEVPDDCKSFSGNLVGVDATSDIYWNQLWLYKQGVLRIDLPSYISEKFKTPVIYEMRPRNNTASKLWNAGSIEFVALRENVDYNYVTAHNDANPHAIVMAAGWEYRWPLVVQARLAYSEMGELSADSDVSYAPENLLRPAVMRDVLNSVYSSRLPTDVYRRLIGGTLSDLAKAKTPRSPTRAGKKRPYFSGVGRGI